MISTRCPPLNDVRTLQETQSSNTLDYGKSPTGITCITQLILVALLVMVSLTGNSSIFILMKRFKSIRTIPNMFLANLAIVDILNTVINLPFFIIVGVLEIEETLHGRWMSLLVGSAQNLFGLLKIMSMLATMMNRYIAISWGLRYYVNKTKRKAARAIFAVWLLSISVLLPWMILASQIDLGDVPTYRYRIAYFNEVGRDATFSIYLMFGLSILSLSLLTCVSYKRKIRRFAKLRKLNYDIRLDSARTRSEAQAAWTIGLTVAVYALCYVPCILYAAVVDHPDKMLSSDENKWFGFAATYFLFFSSGCNPFIYLVRSTRFQTAIKQLLKSPFGCEDVQVERPVGLFKRSGRTPVAPTSDKMKNQVYPRVH